MPRVSVFTPTHNPRFLDDCYRSLIAQSFPDWEWVVLLNGKVTTWSPPEPDPRVRVERAVGRVRGVGAAKRAACELATGDILVELDHDDRLTPTALAEVVDALASHPGATLAYSDFAQINDDGSPNDDRFNVDNGWQYSPEPRDGTTYLRCHAMAASPHNVGYIWYAPNHIRAFRRESYEAVGGYDAALNILDDQDLMVRLYELGDFVHIPQCLYLQRIHRRNTQSDPTLNAEIQAGTIEVYQEHIEHMALAWAARSGLACVALRTPTNVGEVELDERFTQMTIDPDEHPIRCRRRRGRGDQSGRHPATHPRPRAVPQRVLPRDELTPVCCSPTPPAPMAAAPSRTRAMSPSTTRTASCISPRPRFARRSRP